jgi:2'-5' RNA ligase
MRLFVAVEIASDVRQNIEAYLSKLKPKLPNARWVRPEGLHITLKFLGNVAEERLRAIQHELSTVTGTRFPITVRGSGVFPNLKSPRVLWAGLETGPELGALAASVDEGMKNAGFSPEKRTFTPHVTLARFSERRERLDLRFLASEPQPDFGTMTAKEFHLYESKLTSQGSRYTKLSSFSLKWPERPL